MEPLRIFSRIPLLTALPVVIIILSCEKDTPTLPIQDDATLESREKKNACGNKDITVCGKGLTEALARANLGANARITCMGTCLGQDCQKEDAKCLLNGVTLDKKSVKVNIIPGEPPEEDMFEACATFRCHCACGSCNGTKQVGATFTGKNINPAEALKEAAQKAKAWCMSTGCPGIGTCAEGKACQATGAFKIEKVSEVKDPVLPFETTVTVLLTECRCKCADN